MKKRIPFFTVLILIGLVVSVQAISLRENVNRTDQIQNRETIQQGVQNNLHNDVNPIREQERIIKNNSNVPKVIVVPNPENVP